MDYVACKGSWKIEEAVLTLKGSDTFVCPDRNKCYHYHLARVKMIPFYDIVPMQLNKDSRLDFCREFVPTPFPKVERHREGDQVEIPPGIV